MSASLSHTIKKIIEAHKLEIVEDRDFFYKLEKYELNIHDYLEEGFFSVVLYPIDKNTGITNFSKWITLNNLKL